VPSVLPEGQLPPVDGSLPKSVVPGANERDFGLYIHVPFCAARCGYCDFNTYTASELDGVSQQTYPQMAARELELAHEVMTRVGLPPRPLSTVFFGGGTPTLLGPKPLVMLLDRARQLWGVEPGAEITVEANPDSVGADDLAALAGGGVTRVSFGVQSANLEVLATLDRTHDPKLVPQVVADARAAGLQVSLDLIYGAPGETLEQWEQTLAYAVSLAPDHLSAYSLIVEPGTKLAARMKRGELAPIDEDLHADMYVLADQTLMAAGYHWYEISNWARSLDHHSRHNEAYWKSHDWWGIGPGAHSHIGGLRWWNVKHPSAYATRMEQGFSPAHARETLTPEQHHMERILLGLRMNSGIPTAWVGPEAPPLLAQWVSRGLLDGQALLSGRIVLTQSGRLVADLLAGELT
jgi:putative oxygen-independent coproporphyrinogen III oxidase